MRGPLRLPIAAALLFASACFGGDPNPVERDAGQAGVAIQVVGCGLDQGTGLVTATAELTSDREYAFVLVDFRVEDAQGTVVATGTASASGVMPGQTFRLELPLSPSGDPGSGFTCQADLNLATEPIGG